MRKNFKQFRSIYNSSITVWESAATHGALAIKVNDDPNVTIDRPTAHALIRHLIEIAGEPPEPEAPKLTYADLEPGTEFRFDIGDPDHQNLAPVYLKISDDLLRSVKLRLNYKVGADLNRGVVVVHD